MTNFNTFYLKLICKTGLGSVVKTRSVNDALEDNNIKCGTDVSANQEPFKNSENKEAEYSWVKTYNKLNCVTCEKTLHEENSLGEHKRETPDIKAWTNLENHAGGAHRNSFACEICNNSRVDKAHPKKHIRKYHRAKMKAPEEADNIMIKQRITNSHKITEETEDKGLYGHKNFAPLDSICSNCERNWAPTLNS